MNCPRCNMYLAQGAQFCPNCQLNLNQHAYQQQQQNYYAQPGAAMESPKEKQYRKLLVVFAIVFMVEFVLAQLPYVLGLYSFSRIFGLLGSLIWTAAPLAIALVLPKTWSGRNTLVVFASIYILLRVIYLVWAYIMYGGYFFESF